MESDEDILKEMSPRGRYSTIEATGHKRGTYMMFHRQNLTLSNLPQRSRSMTNISNLNNLKKNSWLLPESPTVAEKQSQLTRRKGISGAFSPPPPKAPSVERYLEIFVKLKTAYSDFIDAWEKVDQSSLSAKDKVFFEKCTRKLESKLKKIDDLEELYVHQEHMREGAQNLLDTIERDASKKVKSGRDYCKMSLKRNVARLCAIEDEMNKMSGSIRIYVIGLIGFARLSPGDVYSVNLKHGYNKFCSKCKVVGTGQKWTNSDMAFKINAANDLLLKVSEVRKMNSNAVGDVSCPIGNFLSSDRQEFLLPVNSTGSLKLKISAIWCPFSSKDETALCGKLNLTDLPIFKLDSLSDYSLASSPSSTPKNGTLSSMPSLVAMKGTLTSMKISVNGNFLSPDASVIKRSRLDNDTDEKGWTAALSAKSLPDIAKCCENETLDNDQSGTGSVKSSNEKDKRNSGLNHAISCDALNGKIVLREPDIREKRKVRPVTLAPTFTNGFSYQSDYEDVVNLISTSILGEKPDLIPGEDSKAKSKQRPKSLMAPWKSIPAPDYPNDLLPRTQSPELIPVTSMPDICEPVCAPPPQDQFPAPIPFPAQPQSPPQIQSTPAIPSPPQPAAPVTSKKENLDEVKNLSKPLENNVDGTKIDLNEKQSEKESEELPSDKAEGTSTTSEAMVVDVVKIGTGERSEKTGKSEQSEVPEETEDEDIDEDDLLREIRTALLNTLIKCNEFNTEIEDRLKSLKSVLNDLSLLLKEKKNPISRTPSIENVLNSIDSAFDFLSEHQTLKPERLNGSSCVDICAASWKILKQALLHHLKAVFYLVENLTSLDSPLGVKRDNQIQKLLKQVSILITLKNSLVSSDLITPRSVSTTIDKTKLSGAIWEKNVSSDKLVCTIEQMTSALGQMHQHFNPTTNLSHEVCNEILERMQDNPVYGSDSECITLFQFALLISRVKNLSEYFETIAKEKKVQKSFTSNDDLVIISTMQDRKAIPVVPSILRIVSLLLENSNRTVQRVAVDFLTKLPLNKKDEAIEIYLKMIEDDDVKVREAVCSALKYLEASKGQDMIAHLWKNDVESVRKSAFRALKVIGFPPGMDAENANKKFKFNEASTRF